MGESGLDPDPQFLRVVPRISCGHLQQLTVSLLTFPQLLQSSASPSNYLLMQSSQRNFPLLPFACTLRVSAS